MKSWGQAQSASSGLREASIMLDKSPSPTYTPLWTPPLSGQASQAGELRLSLSPPPGSPLTPLALSGPGLIHSRGMVVFHAQHEVALPPAGNGSVERATLAVRKLCAGLGSPWSRSVLRELCLCPQLPLPHF